MSTSQQYKQPIPWPETPVYQISVEGVKAALMPDGRVMGWTTGYGAPEEVCRMTFEDSGKPWIPKHRNFNSLVKQMFREDDFDALLKFRRDRKQRQQNMKAAAEDMYSALEAMTRWVNEGGHNGANEGIDEICVMGEKALAKARGEQS